mmetsp:Transcript_4177/g.8495  ORF Transcript_4177/g.8495 Transcript_4177/m.8495 type:complete len:341 (+) Transcript_4177:217-1239(+)
MTMTMKRSDLLRDFFLMLVFLGTFLVLPMIQQDFSSLLNDPHHVVVGGKTVQQAELQSILKSSFSKHAAKKNNKQAKRYFTQPLPSPAEQERMEREPIRLVLRHNRTARSTPPPKASSSSSSSLSSSSSSSSSVSLNAVKIEGYDNAMRIIDACAVRGTPSDDLYDAVRFMDKRALQIYPNLQHKQDLWQRAHGSWKLQLATGGGKYRTFKPIPIFAFAVIDEKNFGNGIGFNPNFILFSLLGPHIFRDNIRQMVITIDDVFLGGSSVTSWAPGFVQDAMGIGKRKQQEPAEEKPKTRPPAFTMIAASDKALVARGGSGGIAIWSRLDKDIRPAAYKHRT